MKINPESSSIIDSCKRSFRKAGLNRKGISLLEICIAMALFSVLLFPLWRSLQQSSEIIQLGSQELEILNIGSSFISQASRIPPGVLSEKEENLVLDRLGWFHTFYLDQAKKYPISIAPWDPDTCKISYKVEKFSPNGRFDPVPNGPSKISVPKMLTVNITYKDKHVGEKSIQFPVIIFNN